MSDLDQFDDLILLHGVQSDGDWYRYVSTVLAPHFRVEQPSYDGYKSRWLGLAAVFVEPWGVLVGGIAVGAGVWLGAVGLSFLVAAILSVVPRQRRRTRAIETVRNVLRQFSEQPPKIVAHSWGSYLGWHAVELDPSTASGTMVFVATPLMRQTPLVGLRNRVDSLHNIACASDRLAQFLFAACEIPLVGRLIRLFLPPFVGGAGWKGFAARRGAGAEPERHDVAGPSEQPSEWRCSQCMDAREWVWLHNWTMSGDHSSLLTQKDKIHALVRPILFGIAPDAYAVFRDDCAAVPMDRGWGNADEIAKWRPAIIQLLDRPRPFLPYGSLRGLFENWVHDPRMIRDPLTVQTFLATALAKRVQNATNLERQAWESIPDRSEDYSGSEATPSNSDPRHCLNPFRAVEELVSEFESGRL